MVKQLLAIDFMDKHTSFAHAIDGEIINYSNLIYDSLSAELLNNLDKFLMEQNIKIIDFDAFAVCNGPGGYTSLRVAIATIKGIASSLNKQVQGISKLAASAYVAMQTQDEFQDIISFHKIRDSHYIFAIYNEANLLNPKIKEQFIEFNQAAVNHLPKKAILCGDIPEDFSQMFNTQLLSGEYKILEEAKKDARAIAQLAHARKNYYGADDLDVLYPLPPKIHKKK